MVFLLRFSAPRAIGIIEIVFPYYVGVLLIRAKRNMLRSLEHSLIGKDIQLDLDPIEWGIQPQFSCY